MLHLWTSCLWCLPLNEHSLCFIRFSFCFILFASCATEFLFLYNLLLHCSHSFYFINGHNPVFQFSFVLVNCSFLPYYSVWKFSVQHISVTYSKSMLRTSSSRKFLCNVGFNQDNSAKHLTALNNNLILLYSQESSPLIFWNCLLFFDTLNHLCDPVVVLSLLQVWALCSCGVKLTLMALVIVCRCVFMGSS